MEAGQNLLHYRLIEKIGEGGMGVVWKAHDTKLDRDVAIKSLPEELAADGGRLARFEREAKAVAALNHPNIITVHSVESDDRGLHFFTMELVSGTPLSRQIPKDGLPLGRFLDLAIPLADAISAAHEQGITHRDLKPANVMVTTENRVKVLDFGLAKLLRDTGTVDHEAPTRSMSLTHDGQLMGTIPYMSPEQVEGRAVEHRSDLFSLGVILYEMATGRHPFPGDTHAAVMSAILRDSPASVTERKPELPADLGRIIRHCLQKDVERRYQTARELRNELEELRDEINLVDGGRSEGPGRTGTTAVLVRWGLPVAVATLAVLAFVFWPRAEDVVEGFPTPSVTQVTSMAGFEMFPRVSPNGDWIVYASPAAGNWDLYSQRIGGATRINLTADSPADDTQPSISPDGEFVAFRSDRGEGGVFVMGATGESVRRLSEFGFNPAWSPDGRQVAFATEPIINAGSRFTQSELWIADVATGTTRRIECGDAVQPAWSPDGSRIAYWAVDTGQRDLYTVAVTGGQPVAVTQDESVDWSPAWSPDGAYLYFLSDRGGTMNLWRVRIDQASGRTLAEPQPITVPTRNAAHLDISPIGGGIVYIESNQTWNVQRVPFDPIGANVGEPEWLTDGDNILAAPYPSPDGNWLAFGSAKPHEDIVLMRVDGSEVRRLTDDPAKDRCPSWSPDGDRIAFYSNRSGRYEIWTIYADGRRLAQLTRTAMTGETVEPEGSLYYPLWSPDGTRLSVMSHEGAAIVELDDRMGVTRYRPLALPATDIKFQATSWASSGDKLAGHTIDAAGGKTGVWIYTIGDDSYARVTDRGEFPRWLADDRRLIYWDDGRLLLVDSATGERHELLSTASSIGNRFQVSADNHWIYFTRSQAESNVWLAELP